MSVTVREAAVTAVEDRTVRKGIWEDFYYSPLLVTSVTRKCACVGFDSLQSVLKQTLNTPHDTSHDKYQPLLVVRLVYAKLILQRKGLHQYGPLVQHPLWPNPTPKQTHVKVAVVFITE